jgi:hypothetical protein
LKALEGAEGKEIGVVEDVFGETLRMVAAMAGDILKEELQERNSDAAFHFR